MKLLKGRQIQNQIEVPLNNVLIDTMDSLDPYMVRLGVYPNFLTMLSFVFQLYGIQQLNLNKWHSSVFYLFLGLALDVYDGNYARRHNMESDFGARLDSATDLMVLVILMYVMFDRYSNKKCSVVVSFLLIFFIFSRLYSGCKDKYMGVENKSIIDNKFMGMCNIPENDLENFIEKYKWLGPSHIFVLALIVIYMFETKRLN